MPTESLLNDLQDFLDEHRVRYFSAKELCKLNKDHDFCDKLYVVPPKDMWVDILPTLHAADALRHWWGEPITLANGGGGGGYRPTWYQEGLYNIGTSSTPFGGHSLFRAVDLTPSSFPVGKTRDDWFSAVKLVRQVLINVDASPTAFGYDIYQKKGNKNVHVEIGTPLDKLDGRTSRHAWW
mgnify:CR=1 FL=1